MVGAYRSNCHFSRFFTLELRPPATIKVAYLARNISDCRGSSIQELYTIPLGVGYGASVFCGHRPPQLAFESVLSWLSLVVVGGRMEATSDNCRVEAYPAGSENEQQGRELPAYPATTLAKTHTTSTPTTSCATTTTTSYEETAQSW